MTLDILSVFSPLPPEQNGIADYAYHLLGPLSTHYDCAAYFTNPHAIIPHGVQVYDPIQAFRHLSEVSRILYQIGNNPGHVFVLDALRRWPGVTTLHDQNLHYLYEIAGTSHAAMLQNMVRLSGRMGSAYARHWHQQNVKTQANYVLFDMLNEVLSASSAVVVHSQFAKRRISALYGPTQSAHVAVIPHLALPFTVCELDTESARLKVPRDRPLIVTCGFATAAKRFDWLVEALDEMGRREIEFFWVHAGRERREEFALSGLLEQYPLVRQRARITGYISEDDLNQYIAASDILVNLRFPSVGESSGTLARGMSAGKCCIVSNTAAYSELPRDSVVHVPIHDPIYHLVAALDALLKSEPARKKIGAAAQQFSKAEWAPAVVAAAYRNVIEDSLQLRDTGKRASQKVTSASLIRINLSESTEQADVIAAIGPNLGELEIQFFVEQLEDLAEISLASARMLVSLLPPAFSLSAIRLERSVSGIVSGSALLRVKGTLR